MDSEQNTLHHSETNADTLVRLGIFNSDEVHNGRAAMHLLSHSLATSRGILDEDEAQNAEIFNFVSE